MGGGGGGGRGGAVTSYIWHSADVQTLKILLNNLYHSIRSATITPSALPERSVANFQNALTYQSFKHINEKAFLSDLSNEMHDFIPSLLDLNEGFAFRYSYILKLVVNPVPIKIKSVK